MPNAVSSWEEFKIRLEENPVVFWMMLLGCVISWTLPISLIGLPLAWGVVAGIWLSGFIGRLRFQYSQVTRDCSRFIAWAAFFYVTSSVPSLKKLTPFYEYTWHAVPVLKHLIFTVMWVLFCSAIIWFSPSYTTRPTARVIYAGSGSLFRYNVIRFFICALTSLLLIGMLAALLTQRSDFLHNVISFETLLGIIIGTFPLYRLKLVPWSTDPDLIPVHDHSLAVMKISLMSTILTAFTALVLFKILNIEGYWLYMCLWLIPIGLTTWKLSLPLNFDLKDEEVVIRNKTFIFF